MRSYASWLLWSVVGILACAAALGGVLAAWQISAGLDQQYEERARAVASAVADMPQVRTAVQDGDVARSLPPLAAQLTGAPSWWRWFWMDLRCTLVPTGPSPRALDR